MYMPLRSLHAYSVRVAVCTVTLFGQETRQFMSETLSQLGPFSRRTVTEDLLNSVNTFTLYCDLITIELKEVQQKSLNHALKANKLSSYIKKRFFGVFERCGQSSFLSYRPPFRYET